MLIELPVITIEYRHMMMRKKRKISMDKEGQEMIIRALPLSPHTYLSFFLIFFLLFVTLWEKKKYIHTGKKCKSKNKCSTSRNSEDGNYQGSQRLHHRHAFIASPLFSIQTITFISFQTKIF